MKFTETRGAAVGTDSAATNPTATNCDFTGVNITAAKLDQLPDLDADIASQLSSLSPSANATAASSDELAQVDIILSHGFWRLYFGGSLEKQYQEQQPEAPIGRHRLYIICGLLLTCGFGLIDPLLAPDVLISTWVVRYGVLVPLLIIQLLLSFQSFYPKVSSLFSTLTICITAGALIFIMKSSDAVMAIHYHGLLLLVVLYGNAMTRVKFWHSFLWSVIVLLVYFINVGNVAAVDPLTGYYATLLSVVCLVGLLANYQIEYQARYFFLQTQLLHGEKNRMEHMRDELYKVAVIDSLTGLYNRRHFDEALAIAWRFAYASKTPMSLLFIDIDCFKRFNDTYGHTRGDQCLKVVAEALSRVERRPSDIVARYGGEEFVIILPGMGETKAESFAESIRLTVEELRIPHRATTVKDTVTVSIGVSTVIPGPSSNAGLLVEQADKALYQAKDEGRNRVVVHQRTKRNIKQHFDTVTSL